MKIRFSNPCDDKIIKTRVVPLKGTTPKRVDIDDKNWSWQFTQWDYYFIFECNNGKYSLKVTGGNPDDYYDYSRAKVSVISEIE